MPTPSEPLYRENPAGYYRWIKTYDQCPKCGTMKQKKSKVCAACRKEHRRQIPQPNDLRIRHIPLSRNLFAIVDSCDYDHLMQWKWCAQFDPLGGHFYARRKERVDGKWKHIAMHNVVMGVETGNGVEVDHVSIEDTLDNRRENLRLASDSQQSWHQGLRENNTSGHTGVHLNKRDGMFVAYITCRRKRIHLGSFDTFEEAVAVRLEAERVYFGEFSANNKD